jgi:hypothetical protein
MTKGISEVRQAIISAVADQFQLLVCELLEPLMGWMSPTKRLGLLDQKGIDAFCLGKMLGKFEIVVQCKGFEKLEYGPDQHRQCLAELKKYKKLGSRVKEYWFVVNRPIIITQYRQEILHNLSLLEKSGKVIKAELLDRDIFINRVMQLCDKQIDRWSDILRTEQFTHYMKSMQFTDYVADVPFIREKYVHTSPALKITDELSNYFLSVPEHQTSKHRKVPKLIITSTFGFGKTQTLHAIANSWLANKGHLIFVLAALLDVQAFSNTAGIVHSLLKLLVPDDFECSDLVMKLMRDVLRKRLSKSTNYILLIDGVDEHPSAVRAGSMVAFWHSIQDLGVPVVMSIRDELFENREKEFSMAVKTPQLKGAPPFERIQLQEWSKDIMLKFLDSFESKKTGKCSKEFEQLKHSIKSDLYETIYGDIPKRPLFLGMLAQDAWAGGQPAQKLDQLYGSYFRKKFERDVLGTALGAAFQRSERIVDQHGFDEAFERMLKIMSSFALRLSIKEIIDGVPALIIQEIGGEGLLIDLTRNAGLGNALFEDVLMHSLVQPAGRNQKTRERQVRFSHQSYHEWFLARGLLEKGHSADCKLPQAVESFLQKMRISSASTQST